MFTTTTVGDKKM